MNLLRLVVFHAAITAAATFSPSSKSATCIAPSRPKTSQLHLVSEADVIKSVEIAEKLWDEALAARKIANKVSARAERLGQDAETSTSDVTASLKEGKSISVEKMEEAGRAQNLSLELGSLLDEAVEAQKKADEIEALAEEALKKSEEAFAQFLIDNPEEA